MGHVPYRCVCFVSSQELRRVAHSTALDRGVELLLAPKVAQLRALGPCFSALSRINGRATAIASACDGANGAAAVVASAPSALAEARAYVTEFLPRQRTLMQALAENQLAADDDYHTNPDVFVSDASFTEGEGAARAAGGAGSADVGRRRGGEASGSSSPDRASIAGFLHAKRVPGIKSKPWSRWYFAVHDSALLLWHPVAQDWAVFCGLTGAVCKEAPVGDRVNTFTVSFPRLKHLKLNLQAESRKDVELWLSAVTAASRDLSGSLGIHSQPKGHRPPPVFYSADVRDSPALFWWEGVEEEEALRCGMSACSHFFFALVINSVLLTATTIARGLTSCVYCFRKIGPSANSDRRAPCGTHRYQRPQRCVGARLERCFTHHHFLSLPTFYLFLSLRRHRLPLCCGVHKCSAASQLSSTLWRSTSDVQALSLSSHADHVCTHHSPVFLSLSLCAPAHPCAQEHCTSCLLT
jgi:hypothetical protein